MKVKHYLCRVKISPNLEKVMILPEFFINKYREKYGIRKIREVSEKEMEKVASFDAIVYAEITSYYKNLPKEEDFGSKILEIVSEKLEKNEINDRDIYYLICDLIEFIDQMERPFWIRRLIDFLVSELCSYIIQE